MSPVRRHLAALAAATFLAAAGLVGALAGPAAAAQCSATTGVSVVVDFNRGAGGGISTACDAGGGGKYASAIFPESGFPLTYTSGSGFVCRVSGAPANADCSTTAPADAYWGLFWARPGATSWTYASSGVGGLRVPDGGAVAWAFQDGGGTDAPGVAPSQRSQPSPAPPKAPVSQPAPTKASSPRPSSAPRPTTAAGTGGPSAAGSPASAQQKAKAQAKGTTTAKAQVKATAKASASALPSATSSPSSSPTTSESSSAPVAGDDPTLTPTGGATTSTRPADDGVPAWVPGAAVVGLMGAAGGAVWLRRRGLVP